jgi:hypothetical protein
MLAQFSQDQPWLLVVKVPGVVQNVNLTSIDQ